MVSLISTSLQSALFKLPKLQVNPPYPIHRPNQHFCSSDIASRIQIMALANDANTGAHVRSLSSSEGDETIDSIISASSTPPTPSTIRNASKSRSKEHVIRLSSI